MTDAADKMPRSVAGDAAAGHPVREPEVQRIVEDCLCRRAAGEALSDEQVCTAHPDLMPDLATALQGLAVIERARTTRGGRASRVAGSDPDVPADAIPGYHLLREIHRGGQGVVYRALQKSTGRRVALKVLLDGAFAGPLDRARFEREVRVLAALRHPNIVTIHDSGSASGRFFFVMDYIPGQPLDVFMSSEPRSITHTLELFGKICAAVGAAHLQGIIHRDLKPGNIRVDAGGEPTLLDFGLARLVQDPQRLRENGDPSGATLSGQFVGSLPWAAPEQAEGLRAGIDTRTDVYALGVVLYHMLTGKFPYRVVGSMHEVARYIAHEPPLSPRRLRPEIEDDLATIMLKCLAKDRDRRYQTAGELGRDIERYLRGEPVEARRDSSWYVLRKSLRRYRAVLAIAASFVILLMVSTAVSWTLWLKAERSSAAEARGAAQARESLWVALLGQARAMRTSGHSGQRCQALQLITQAAAIRPSPDLRNEMIATLAVTDVKQRRPNFDITGSAEFDRSWERCAVISEDDHSVTILRVLDGSPLAHVPATPPGSSEIYKLVLAADYLVRVFDPPQAARRLEVWSVSQDRLILQLDDLPPKGGFDVSADASTLAVARQDQAIHLYDLRSATFRQRFALDRQAARMAFDPQGRRLALFHGPFESAQILDLYTGLCSPAFGSSPVSWSVAWTPDGRVLAGASVNHIELWDPDGQRSLGSLRGHDGVITLLGAAHDGARLASCTWDGVTILWDLPSRRPLVELRGSFAQFAPHDEAIGGWSRDPPGGRGTVHPDILELVGRDEFRTLQVTADPDVLASNQASWISAAGLLVNAVGSSTPHGGLYLLDPDGDRQLAHLPVGYSLMAMTDPCTRSIVSFHVNHGLYRWPLEPVAGGLRVGPPCMLLRANRCDGLALSGDGRIAAVSEVMGKVAVVDLEHPADTWRFDPLPGGVVRALSSDGRWVVVLTWHEHGGEVWDRVERRRVATLSTSGNAYAVFSPDDRRLVTADLGALRVWDTASWTTTADAPGIHACPAFSPDGGTLAVTAGDHNVHLLDAGSLQPLCVLEAPQRFATTGITFGADGTILQMTNRAGIGYIWDLCRIRQRLAELGLDWEPALPPADSDAPHRPIGVLDVRLGALQVADPVGG